MAKLNLNTKKFFVEDNVCSPYKLILNRTHNYLLSNGYESTEDRREADCIVIGTCAAFKSLEDETVSFIEKANKERKKDSKLVVFGCLPGIDGKKVKSYKPDVVIPAASWERIELLVDNPVIPLREIPETSRFRSEKDWRLPDKSKQFILLQTGCSSNCPFCPHKMGIGRLKSKKLDDILYQVHNLPKYVKTICLTGNDTGSYGTDIGTSLPELLRNILETTDLHIHLSQINPNWVYYYRDELYSMLRNPKIREFQTLIQSTSNRLLNLMERDPVVMKIKPFLCELKSDRKDLILRTDLIIGYPTSTEEEDFHSCEYVGEIFHEVAIHAFERFPHARIEKINKRKNIEFYDPGYVEFRTKKVIKKLQKYPGLLISRGGQVIKTLEKIEKPKDMLRKEYNEQIACY